MAQALAAAQHLAGPDRSVHQFGCHFLRPGDVTHDVELEADELSNGRSFSAIHVRAVQKGKNILAMTASFQVPEKGLEHSYQHRFARDGTSLRPEWKKPDELVSVYEHMKPFISTIPEPLRPLYEHKQPLEVRPAECARTPFVGAVVVAHPPITQVRAALGEGSPRPRARELDQVPPAYPLRPQGARAAARLHLGLGPSGDIGVPARDWDVGAEDANGVAVAHHALPPSFQAGRGVGLPRHVRAVAGGERSGR